MSEIARKPRPDERRKSAHERGYGHKWQQARIAYLREHPLCVMCQQDGKLTPAQVVDHIIPHKGNSELFWDSQNNWQALCKLHHDSYKHRLEIRGHASGCDVNGMPIDSSHHWSKG